MSWGPVFRPVERGLRVRWNRQRIEMAQTLTGTRLTPTDVAALDAFDEVVARPGLAVHHQLDTGECLVVDDHRVLHGRSAFVDHDEPDRRRCLVRVLLRLAA